MSNGIVVKGNVTKEPDTIRYTTSGTASLTFGLADNQGYGDKKTTTFWRVTLWGKQAESLHPYIIKGGELTVVGEASLRPWTDKQGVEKTSLELRANDVWLGKKPESRDAPPKPSSSGQRSQPAPSGGDNNAFGGDFDDDIPFAKLRSDLY
jgi:single-strand DNA-binding protein